MKEISLKVVAFLLFVVLVALVEGGKLDWLIMTVGKTMEFVFIELPITVIGLFS